MEKTIIMRWPIFVVLSSTLSLPVVVFMVRVLVYDLSHGLFSLVDPMLRVGEKHVFGGSVSFLERTYFKIERIYHV